MSPFFIKLTGLKQRPQCTDGIVNILLHEIFSLISHYSIGREESHTKCSQVTSLYSGTSTMASTRTPSSAGRGARRGATRGGGQVGVHQTRRQAAPQPEVGNMGQPQAAMPYQVQGQGVQDAPPPVPTVALPADAVARLLNVLEALVPTQGGSSAPPATLQTQAPAQTQTFGNKEVSLQEFLKLKSPKFTGFDNSADP
ncbi:uncharacterized protein [Nicotiana tomentosiformis]|uniref:uncharacterized protein isoform X1 n=1 Tax=Nicotiana tomentosiformis TaxID=4098 RepID=UPI00051C6928|nr:uncharacterized protein LOC104113003 isoform X1 [Nicotiana tomentosiformis]XP_018632098.1 uncharacterized protein LOC104113003 isoform X1 [Nicotiana tomentosiformis]